METNGFPSPASPSGFFRMVRVFRGFDFWIQPDADNDISKKSLSRLNFSTRRA
jgi:hypothetical protein